MTQLAGVFLSLLLIGLGSTNGVALTADEINYDDLKLMEVDGASETKKKIEYDGFKAMETAASPRQKDYARKYFTLFIIIAPEFSKKDFSKSMGLWGVDFLTFARRVEDWKATNEDRWSEVRNRLVYFQREVKLGTAIDDVDPDVRWEVFLRYGRPERTTRVASTCSGGSPGCELTIYFFSPIVKGRKDFSVGCLSEEDRKYPTKIILGDKDHFPDALPIYPQVNVSRFYGDSLDGKVEAWFSVWVPGDQLTRATLYEKELLETTVTIFRKTKWDDGHVPHTPVTQQTDLGNLGGIRGTLENLVPWDRAGIRAMGYLRFALEPGEYQGDVTVVGAENNSGSQPVDFTIPERDDSLDSSWISDLLIVDRTILEGSNVAPCIQRGEAHGLCDNPEGWIPTYKGLDLYVETKVPKKTNRFTVEVTLLRIPEGSDKGKRGFATVLPHQVVGDSLSQPYERGEFGTVPSPEYRTFHETSMTRPDPKGIKTLMRQKFSVDPEKEIQTLRISTALRGVEDGKYELAFVVRDEDSGCFLRARREIHVGAFPIRSN